MGFFSAFQEVDTTGLWGEEEKVREVMLLLYLSLNLEIFSDWVLHLVSIDNSKKGQEFSQR